MRNFKQILPILVIWVLLFTSSSSAEAAPSLSEIGSAKQTEVQTTTTTTVEKEQSLNMEDSSGKETNADSNIESAEAVAELFHSGGLTEESIEEASILIKPIAEIINLISSIVLALLAAFLILVSVLDLVYIEVPATRSYLYRPAVAPTTTAIGGIQPNFFTRKFGQDMNQDMGIGAGMGSSMIQTPGVRSTQFVSDDAVATLMEAQAANTPAIPMMGQRLPQPTPGGRSAIMLYLRKRTFSLLLLGVCVLLFTGTVFTDIGVKLGVKLVSMLSNIFLIRRI